jgi:hypothetical protein
VRPTVIVAGQTGDASRRFVDALGEVLEVRVVHGPPAPGEPYDAVIAVGSTDTAAGVPTITFDDPAADLQRAVVRFENDAAVDRRLRGVEAEAAVQIPPVVDAGATTLASALGAPVWTMDPRSSSQRVRAPLPEVDGAQPLPEAVGASPLAGVALVQFLRSIGAAASVVPPSRACFLIDDPNLRWRSYGFVDFAALADDADRYGYHVAVAMVPVDGWPIDRRARAAFARPGSHLSLLFHGNDHVRRELARPGSTREASTVVAQAVRRIERFERRSGLDVERVMVAPHGLCSEPTMSALLALGFDALCYSGYAPRRDDTRRGWSVADLAVGGLPIIRRVPLTASDFDVALRLFLDQPIVLYGHQTDLADLGVLHEWVEFLDDRAEMQWMSPGRIAATNVVARRRDDVLEVVPFTRRGELDVPGGVASLSVERPPGATLVQAVRISGPDGLAVVAEPGARVDVVPGRYVVELDVTGPLDAWEVVAPPWRPWARARRSLAEARDRAAPLLSWNRR